MYLPRIIPTQLLLLFLTPPPYRVFDIPVFILTADHEADLPRRIGGDGCVGVFGNGEHFAAGLFEGLDEGEVEPLVFRYRREKGSAS